MTENSAKSLVEAQLKNTFHMFDMDGKGTIQIKYFGTIMRSLGFNMNEELAFQIAGKIDTEGTDHLTYDQFKRYLLSKMSSEQVKKQFYQAFSIMDVDKDGFISFQDLKLFLESVGEPRGDEQIRQMLQDADVDGDEHINYQQFVRLMITR